jgi:hypothetical protein
MVNPFPNNSIDFGLILHAEIGSKPFLATVTKC